MCRHVTLTYSFVSLTTILFFMCHHQLLYTIPLYHCFKICPFLCITQSKKISDRFWRFRPFAPGVFVHSSVSPTGKYFFLVTLCAARIASQFGWAASRTQSTHKRGEGDASYRRSAAGVVGLGRWASRIRHDGATVDRGARVTWLLNAEPMSAMMEVAWIVLDGLLLGKPSSPLRKVLEDSRLGEETIGGGLDNELLQSTFAIGMKGIKNLEDRDALEDLIMATLRQISSDGFNDDEVASTMNTIEFSLREGGGGLRGMEIFLGALTKWNYDASPRDALVYEDVLKLMKDEIKMGGWKIFQRMITDSLVSNSHRVVLELYPSTTLEEESFAAPAVMTEG